MLISKYIGPLNLDTYRIINLVIQISITGVLHTVLNYA